MADTGGEKSRRKKGKKAGKKRRKSPASGRKRSVAQQRAALISAINYPLRRRILRVLDESEEERSPAEIARQLNLVVGSVSYHVSVLRALGAVKLVREGRVRGAVEHFYASSVKNDKPIETLLEETREADE